MDAIFTAYIDSDFLSWVVGFLQLVPAGLLLAMFAWVVGYAVAGLVRLLKG